MSLSSTSPRPIARAHHPAFSAALRREAADFLHAKGCTLRPAYAALCLMQFLHDHAGLDAVCSADIRALFPRPVEGLAGALRHPNDVLRRAAARRLAEPLGDGWYRLTTLGRAVVAVLPDGEQVALMRGCRTVTPQVGRRLGPGALR